MLPQSMYYPYPTDQTWMTSMTPTNATPLYNFTPPPPPPQQQQQSSFSQYNTNMHPLNTPHYSTTNSLIVDKEKEEQSHWKLLLEMAPVIQSMTTVPSPQQTPFPSQPIQQPQNTNVSGSKVLFERANSLIPDMNVKLRVEEIQSKHLDPILLDSSREENKDIKRKFDSSRDTFYHFSKDHLYPGNNNNNNTTNDMMITNKQSKHYLKSKTFTHNYQNYLKRNLLYRQTQQYYYYGYPGRAMIWISERKGTAFQDYRDRYISIKGICEDPTQQQQPPTQDNETLNTSTQFNFDPLQIIWLNTYLKRDKRLVGHSAFASLVLYHRGTCKLYYITVSRQEYIRFSTQFLRFDSKSFYLIQRDYDHVYAEKHHLNDEGGNPSLDQALTFNALGTIKDHFYIQYDQEMPFNIATSAAAAATTQALTPSIPSRTYSDRVNQSIDKATENRWKKRKLNSTLTIDPDPVVLDDTKRQRVSLRKKLQFDTFELLHLIPYDTNVSSNDNDENDHLQWGRYLPDALYVKYNHNRNRHYGSDSTNAHYENYLENKGNRIWCADTFWCVVYERPEKSIHPQDGSFHSFLVSREQIKSLLAWYQRNEIQASVQLKYFLSTQYECGGIGSFFEQWYF